MTRIDAIGNTGNASLQTADAATLTLLSGINTGSLSTAQVNGLFSVLRSVGQFQGLLGQVRSNTVSVDAAIANANAVISTANAAIDALFAGQVQPGSSPVYETLIGANGRSAVGQIDRCLQWRPRRSQ